MSGRSQARAHAAAEPVSRPAADPLQRQGIITPDVADDVHGAGDAHLHGEPPLGRGRAPDLTAPVPDVHAEKWDERRNFTRLRLRRVPKTVRDADAARAWATRLLIEELAPLLGLDPERIEVRVDAEAGARTNAHGADGLMDGGRILLHPGRYAPETQRGRYLLAHEAVHAAQRDPAADAASVPDAEREADEIARAFAEGRVVPQPVEALPALAAAADADVGDVADASVAGNRPRELAMIKKWLGGLWVSDGDVDDILTLLASLPKATAMALVRSLKDGERYDLVNNFKKSHYRTFREQVLLVYRAMPPDQIRDRFDEDLLVDIDMFELSNDEALAVAYTYQNLKPKPQQKLLASKVGRAIGEIKTYASNSANRIRATRDYQESIAAEKREQDVLTERHAKAKRRLEAEDTGPALRTVIVQIRQRLSKFWIKDEDALTVLDLVEPHAADAASLDAIVEGLVDLKTPPANDPERYEETKNYLDVLLDELPVEKLYDRRSSRLHVLVRLMSFRPPYKNIALARKLINAFFSDSEDAFLAFHLVKALPEREQQAFIKAGGGETWSTILRGMSLSQREALTVNLYNAGKDQGDRNSILMQLMDDRVWANPGRLSGLVRMAIAAGNYAWVFGESERRIRSQQSLLENPDLLAVVERYKLYNPRPDARDRDGVARARTTFDPDAYKPASFRGKTAGEEGVAGWIREKIFGGIDFVLKSDPDVFLSLFRKSIGGKNAIVAELQDISGGDFVGGITFERHENLGAAGREALSRHRGVNFAEQTDWDLSRQVLKLKAGDLAIANVHLPLGVAKLQATHGAIRALSVEIGYAAGHRPGISKIDVQAGSVELEDVLVILPSAMYGANEAMLERLGITTRESGSDPANDPQPRQGLLALGFGFFSNLAGIAGASRELAENLLKPSVPMEVDMTFGSIKAEGVTTSAGQYAAAVSIEDVQLHGGGDAAAYRKALLRSKEGIERRIRKQREVFGPLDPVQDRAVERLEKRLRGIAAELAMFTLLDDLEARKRKHRENPSGAEFTDLDEAKLAELKTKLAGVVLEVGAVTVEGIEGVPGGRLHTEDIHGRGRSLGALLGTGLATQFLQGASTIQPAPRRDASFTFEVGHLEGGIELHATVPTPEEAERDAERFSKKLDSSRPGQAEKLKALQLRAQQAADYDALLRRGVEKLGETDRKRLFDLRNALEADRGFRAGAVSAEGVTLSATETGDLTAHVDAITAEDIREGGTGTSIERVVGRDIDVKPKVEEGLFGFADWRRNLKGGTVNAGQLDFTNIRHAGSGTLVRTLGLRKAEVSATRGGPIALKASGIDVANVTVTQTRKLLVAERELLLAVPQSYIRQDDNKKLQAIEASLTELDRLDARVTAAAAELDRARVTGKPARVKKAEAALAAAEKARLAWQERLAVRGLSVDNLSIIVEGIGDVLSEDFDLDAVLAKGITVRGTGAGGRMLDKATLTDAHLPGLSGRKVTLGPTGGSITLSDRQTKVTGFFIDSLTVTDLDYRGAGAHLWSKGTSTLTKLTVDATVDKREMKHPSGYSEWEPAKITFEKLEIGRIDADRLGYTDDKGNIHIDVESGSVARLSAKGLVIELSEEEGSPQISGKAKIGGLRDLRLHAVLGKTLAVKGTLTGSDLRAELFGDAKQLYHIGDLSVRDGEIGDPKKGTIKVSVSHLSGDIAHIKTQTGDRYDFRRVKLDLLTLGKGSTWEDAGTKLELLGPASVKNLHVTASVTRRKVGNDDRLDDLKITDLTVDQIAASNVHLTLSAQPADPKNGLEARPEKRLSLANATITDLRIEGYDLLKQVGSITTGALDVKELGLQIAKRGERAFKEANVSIKGTKLAAQLRGPGSFSIDLGHIEILTASYADDRTDVKAFSVKDVTGRVEIGRDNVRLLDVNAGPVKLGHATYGDAAGNKVSLDGADIAAVHLVELEAKFSADPKTKETTLSSLVVKELKLDDVRAESFSYSGSVTTLNKEKQPETTRREVKARSARIEPLHIEEMNLDVAKDVHHIKGDIGKVGLTGFSAVFESSVAGKLVKSTRVAGNVMGADLRANLDFEKVKLASGGDWTRASGTFHLGSLGLYSPDVDFTEFAGATGKTRIALSSLEKAGIDVSRLSGTIAPNGTLLLNLDAIAAHGLKLRIEKTGKTIDVALPVIQIKTIAASLGALGLDRGLELLAAETGKITTEGLSIDVHVDRKVTAGAAPSGTAEPFVIEPLRDAEGDIRLKAVRVEPIEGLPIPLEWLTLPVHKGAIDLDSVTLEGFFGDEKPEDPEKKLEKKQYTLSIDDEGIVVIVDYKNFPTFKARVPDTKGRAGLYKNRGKHGTIVLQEFIEGYLNAAPDPKAPKVMDLGFLEHVGFDQSNFQLGTGRIGTASNFVVLSSPVPGANLVKILSTWVGGEVGIDVEKFRSSGAGFSVKENEGTAGEKTKTGTTGEISFTNVKVRIKGLGNISAEFDITLRAERGVIDGVKFGDLSLLSAPTLAAEQGPKLQEGAR